MVSRVGKRGVRDGHHEGRGATHGLKNPRNAGCRSD